MLYPSSHHSSTDGCVCVCVYNNTSYTKAFSYKTEIKGFYYISGISRIPDSRLTEVTWKKGHVDVIDGVCRHQAHRFR